MSGKVVTFGEIMLRLKSPGYERFLQSPALEATFGGGEANVAVSLANYGMDAAFVRPVRPVPPAAALHGPVPSTSVCIQYPFSEKSKGFGLNGGKKIVSGNRKKNERNPR